MKLKCLGAAGLVTGSSFWVESESGSGLMVDMGMFQGIRSVERLNREPMEIDLGKLCGVIITHAHLDHCGRLPLLANLGYKKAIYMTAPTREIVEIGLMDSVKLAKEGDNEEPLYGEDEVAVVMNQVEEVEYHQKVSLEGFRFWLVDAGHILGSASVIIEEIATGKRLVISGDLGNTPGELVQPTEFVDRADWVAMESTYGDRLHGAEDEESIITEVVTEAEKRGGVVLIPTFSIQRSQQLLYMFDQLKKGGKVKNETKVYLDSPMAIRVTDVYKRYPELYSNKLQIQTKIDDPFDFPGLVIVENVQMSKRIKDEDGVKVIIAGSGMMNGGRIVHHALQYLGDSKTEIVFVGYQAEGTLGRKILEGDPEVSIYGQRVEVKAKIREITSMSAHADQKQLLDWLGKINGVTTVVLIHGDEKQRLMLDKLISEKYKLKVLRPRLEENIILS